MSLNYARQFAAFLDANNYDAASGLLSEGCTYHYSEGNYQGRENIISIYRMNHQELKKIMDEITYSSVAEELPDETFKIQLVDKLRLGHKWHEFRSFQIVTIKDEQITHIEHCEIPGEIEALRMFYTTSRAQKINLP